MATQPARSAPAVFIIAILLAAFFVMSWTAWTGKSATYDEPLHFVASWVQTHVGDFRCDPEDPPLWRYYVAAGLPKERLTVPTTGVVWDSMLTNRAVEGLYFKDVLYHTPGNDADAAISSGRLRMLFLGVVLGAAIAAWAWRLAGAVAGFVAVAAFCFDPNFLAHAALVKNDVAAAMTFLLFAWTLWAVGNRATPLRWIALSLVLAAALTVKFSGVLAVPLLVVGLLIRALLPEPWVFGKWLLRSRGRRIAAAGGLALASCLVGYVAIWACYGFRYGPSANPGELFDFAELLQIARTHEYFAAYNAFVADPVQQQVFFAHWQPGIILRLGLWANTHHLFPQTWLEGFLFTYGTSPGRATFLLGTYSMVGRWDYFPVAMLVKTPLATLAALLGVAIYWIFARGTRLVAWNCIAFFLVPVVYLAVAISSDLNLGIRHILPVYPFLFIAIGVTAADAVRRFRKPATITISIVLIGLATESLAAYPDYIPFFSVAFGGWRQGPNLLGDSNVDWGQDLPALAEWQRDHPRNQLFLGYFGSADPRYYQIHYVKLPGGQGPDDESPQNWSTAVYAISANIFQNPWLTEEQKEFYNNLWWRQQPIAVLGHCIYLYNAP